MIWVLILIKNTKKITAPNRNMKEPLIERGNNLPTERGKNLQIERISKLQIERGKKPQMENDNNPQIKGELPKRKR